MDAADIIAKVRALNLPDSSYIVFGSCPLALAGIRQVSDIDLIITPELDEVLEHSGWRRIPRQDDDRQLVYGQFDTHTNWRIGSYDPTLQELLGSATVVEGIPFGSLAETRKWKLVYGRAKDLEDVKLIDTYLAAHPAAS